MSKLFELKNWLSIPEAAKHLTSTLEEEVTAADVLRLALDGHLKLSAHIGNDVKARRGKLIPINEADYKEAKSFNSEGTVRLYGGIIVLTNGQESHIIKIDNEIFKLNGLYDLPMLGAERNRIEYEYCLITREFFDYSIYLNGAFVEGENGEIFQIQEHYTTQKYKSKYRATGLKSLLYKTELLTDALKDFNKPITDGYIPASELPPSITIVARTSVLREFEESIIKKTTNTDIQLTTTARAHVSNNLETLIKAATKFWSRADRDDRTTHPNNSDVVTWLIDRGFSQRTAEAGATIIRPGWAPTGRKPEE